jgi:hypothetical protein
MVARIAVRKPINNSAEKPILGRICMSTSDKYSEKDEDKKGTEQVKGVDLTNLAFTPDGAVQGLPDEALDSVTGGLMSTNTDCNCTDTNVGC